MLLLNERFGIPLGHPGLATRITVSYGRVEIVTLLMEKCVGFNAEEFGRVLKIAVSNDRFETVDLFIKNDYELTADDAGQSVEFAFSSNRVERVELLIERLLGEIKQSSFELLPKIKNSRVLPILFL